MKKVFIVLAIATFAACNNASEKSAVAKVDSTVTETVKKVDVTYSYPVSYSSDFSIGDAALAAKITELWKDFDDNTFDKHKSYFADSVNMIFRDGSKFTGTLDSLMKMVKGYRGSLKACVSTIDAITTLKPNGKDESWVCVWGNEKTTNNKGKVDSAGLHEAWMFDKDGKVAYMHQFASGK